jgi:LPS-assembly lipoprotein
VNTGSIRQLQCLLLAACLAITLCACGFQMRGSASLPEEMSVTYIKSSKRYSTLVTDFADALRVHHVVVTEDRDEATAILDIIDDKQDKSVLSVNTSGKVLEYQLQQSIEFDVKTSDQQTLLEPQRVSLTRDYLYSNTDVLSKEREQVVVRRALQRELISLAILRITAAAR